MKILVFLLINILYINANSTSKAINQLSPDLIKDLPPDGGSQFNRLIFEKSPYLLQHARNPVDWHPWNSATLELAKSSNKPIFLSIGYSSCHWCHVMKRESFIDSNVAKILNESFIPVKVDREERPDIDRIYMVATQLIREGRGGWPNNLWLTPKGLPFFAGTYFKKEKFIDILKQLSSKWTHNPKEITESAAYMKSLLEQMLDLGPREAVELDIRFVDRMILGFTGRLKNLESIETPGPKFPPHQILHFLTNLAINRNFSNSQSKEFKSDLNDALTAVFKLLKRLAYAGIYDHVGGGFHRYSTDSKWFLPHYEKMLYDNTQLAQAFAAAYELSKDKLFANVAHEIFTFLERDMLVDSGLYASAIDAESKNQEGLFYFWTTDQLATVLPPNQYKTFVKNYGVLSKGNFIPENGSTNLEFNTLSKLQSVPWDFDKNIREKLRLHRSKRTWPLIDDKVLCDWNALAIESLAKASVWLKDSKLLQRAERIASKLMNLLWVNNQLYHHGRNGNHGSIGAYLSDYAYLARALFFLHRVSGKQKYAQLSNQLLRSAWQRFYDSKSQNLYNTDLKHNDLIFRAMNLDDDVLPAAPAVFLEANLMSNDKVLVDKAIQVAPFYLGQLVDNPAASVSYLPILIRLNDTLNQSSQQVKPDELPINNHPAPITSPKQVKTNTIVKILKHPLEIKASLESNLIRVKINIKEGFHINSSEPYQDYLIPTKLELINRNEIEMEQINYPLGEDLQLDFSEEDISVYEGTVYLESRYKITNKIAKSINLILHTQACSESECLPPQKHSIRLLIN